MTKTLLRHQQRQTITVDFPKSATLARRLSLCGEAIRKKHASMTRLAPISLTGASRLVRITATGATYEVWLRNTKEAPAP